MTQSPASDDSWDEPASQEEAGSPWPTWLQDIRLSDDALAEAYEQSPAAHRALVKQCLALLHALWGESCEEESTRRVDKARGFCATRQSRPAPWALFVVSAEYNAPTRLAAALMPALLARVPHVAVLCVGGMPSVGTRIALELAGIQDIFCPSTISEVEDCLHELVQNTASPREADQPKGSPPPKASPPKDSRGCVALLHHNAPPCSALTRVARTAKALHLPLWEEASAPCIMDATGQELVAVCHPDMNTSSTTGSTTKPPTDTIAPPLSAVFGLPAKETAQTRLAPLRIAQGLEGFWLHPTLEPSFFRRHSLCITPYTGEDPWART